MNPLVQFLLAPAFVGLVLLGLALHYATLIVRQGEVVIVERLGQFQSVKQPGFHWLVPLIDRTRAVHWTRRIEKKGSGHSTSIVTDVYSGDRITVATVVFDIPPVQCVTREHLEVGVNIVVYYRVTDAHKAVYAVQDLYAGIELKVQTLLMGMVHDLSYENLTTQALQHAMAERMKTEVWPTEWGLFIERFEVQSVELPGNLKKATLETVTQRRTMEAEQLSQNAARAKQLTELDTLAAVDAKKREATLAGSKHNYELQKLANELANEKARGLADAEAYGKKAQLNVEDERQKAKYAAMKASGLSDAYFIALQQSKATRAVFAAGIAGQNKTLIMPYEALTGNGGGGGNALLTTRLLCPEQPIVGTYDMSNK